MGTATAFRMDYYNMKIIKEASSILEQKQKYFDKVRECDLAIADLLHELELAPLNCAETAHVVRMLKKYLRERRQNKNMVRVITETNKQGIQYAARIVASLQPENVYYRPRVLKGLKVEALNADRRAVIDEKLAKKQELTMEERNAEIRDHDVYVDPVKLDLGDDSSKPLHNIKQKQHREKLSKKLARNAAVA